MPAVKKNGLGRTFIFKLNSIMTGDLQEVMLLSLGLSFSNYQVRLVNRIPKIYIHVPTVNQNLRNEDLMEIKRHFGGLVRTVV